jgi:hypothetical protein
MVQVTLEYMIMVPVLIMQIFIFPFAANMIMNTWVDTRRELSLQETAGHLGSSIQQLYYTINRATVSSGSLTLKLDTPPTIEGYGYTITFGNASGSDTKILRIIMHLNESNVQVSTLVTLGQNAVWQNNANYSSTQVSIINATKIPSSNTIYLALQGGG